MAQKDMASKKLEDYPDVFADIVNTLLFHKNLLNPDLLRDGPTESIYKTDNEKWNEQRRDILKEVINGERYMIAAIGIENQAKYESIMPIRIMGYDYGSYRQQINDGVPYDELKPVITIVLNFSERKWGHIKSLHNLLNIPEEYKPYVQDYKIHVFDIAYLYDETIDTFQSDFKSVALFFRAKRLDDKSILSDKTIIKHVNAFLELLSVFTSDPAYRILSEQISDNHKKGQVTSMCDIAQGLLAQGKAVGKAEGKAEGRLDSIVRLIRKGISLQDVKNLLDASDDEIEKAKTML